MLLSLFFHKHTQHHHPHPSCYHTQRQSPRTPQETVKTASEAIQIGLTGLLSRPIIKAIFPSETQVSRENNESSPSPAGKSSTDPPLRGLIPSHIDAETRSVSSTYSNESALNRSGPTSTAALHSTIAPQVIDNHYLPELYTKDRVHPIIMETANHHAHMTMEDHSLTNGRESYEKFDADMTSNDLANRTENMSLTDGFAAGYQDALKDAAEPTSPREPEDLAEYDQPITESERNDFGRNDDDRMALGSALASDPAQLKNEHPNDDRASTRTGATQRTTATKRTGVTQGTGETRPT